MRVPPLVNYWMPAIAWMILIFVGSTDVLSAEHTSRFLVPFLHWLDPHLSWKAINAIQTVIRKLGHVTEYAILAALLWRAVRGAHWQVKISLLFIAVWIACAIFAATDEFHQSFVPSRTASPRDVMIDICGAFIGLAICWIFARQRRAVAAIN
jgi:VanZ family protein